MMNFYTEKDFFNFVRNEIGVNLFNGQGIINRPNGKSVLRSVDGTIYYADNLTNPASIQYTLFGREGDQDMNEPRFNHPLLSDPNRQIYVYRRHELNGPVWTWMGRYRIVGLPRAQLHPDINGQQRIIFIITLVPF